MHKSDFLLITEEFQNTEPKRLLNITSGLNPFSTPIQGSNLRLTFQDFIFNICKAFFKLFILSQLCFYAHNDAAD